MVSKVNLASRLTLAHSISMLRAVMVVRVQVTSRGTEDTQVIGSMSRTIMMKLIGALLFVRSW